MSGPERATAPAPTSSVPVDVADRARVLRDPDLLVRFRVAFGEPGGVDALRRADDPERPGPDGSPSPFAGLEILRRTLFAPDAAESDLVRWRRLEGLRAAEHGRVDAAVATALAGGRQLDGAVPPAPARVGRRRLLIGVVVVVVLVAVLTTAVGERARPRISVPASAAAVIEPPPLDGTTILTLTDHLEPGITATSTVNWNSGYDPLQPDGFGLGVALRCRGAGRVVVRLTNGESFAFRCTETARTFIRRSPAAHPDALVVFVPTTGRVLWGLRIVTLPLTR